MQTQASQASPRVPSVSAHPVAQPPQRADGELFLRPARVAENRRASQPRTADEFVRRVESLRRAPAKLTADDAPSPQHASIAAARSGRQADATESVANCAHLLMPTRL